jgi:small ligand-binding sensory domain FIST
MFSMANSAASRLVSGPYAETTVRDAARECLREVGGSVTCVFAFVSADFRPHLEEFLELVQVHGHAPLVVGCSASGLIGTGVEVEHAPGFSLLFFHLPDTVVTPFTLRKSQVEESSGPDYWNRRTGLAAGEVDAWLLLADPVNFSVERWLIEWNKAYPKVPCIGGLCSGGALGDDIFIFQNRKVIEDGSVALALKGGVRLHPLLSQGCTPIGHPLAVTGAAKNTLLALGGKPAYEVLASAFESLSDEEKRRAQGNLFAGLATSEYLDDFKRGDFLIRNILGADAETGAVTIAAYPRVGQTLQYQLRDRRSAGEDLQQRLTALRRQGVEPFASLMFSCTGRGKNLFGTANHDAGALDRNFAAMPGAGFFCNGEIGPVGPTNFVHGYTVSLALFANA